MADIEYREETPEGWAQRVADTWTVDEEAKDALRLSGPCPTCGHHSELLVEQITAVKSGGRGRLPLTLLCRCTEGHPGRPDGRRGCGRGAPFELDLDG